MTGAKLREIRERLGWSQSQAAEALKVGGTTPEKRRKHGASAISRLERGDRTVPGYIESSIMAHARLAECEAGAPR